MVFSTSGGIAPLLVAISFIVSPPLGADTSTPSIRILVDQAGYDLAGPKSILLQTDFEPSEIAAFEVVRGAAVVGSGAWGKVQPVAAWSQWYRGADLPTLSTGTYTARVAWRGLRFESAPFRVEPERRARWTGPLTCYFFYAQRCGCAVPGWHGPCHLDDARLPDGSHRDLTGGWHDAGDLNKYNGYTPLAVYALAKFAGSRAASAINWPAGQPRPVEEAEWGANWLEKCRDAASGKIIGQVFSGFGFWGRPEDETDNTPGTADDRPAYPLDWNENEMAAAAWSALYQATGNVRWKNLALGMWDVIAGHDPGTNLGLLAKRLLAAEELYRSTSDNRYIEAADRDALALIARQEADGGWPVDVLAIVDYGFVPAALASFARALPADSVTPAVRESLGRYLDFWNARRLLPFSVPRWNADEMFYLPESGDWYVGQNSMYLSQAWAGSLMADVLGEAGRPARRWAAGCLDWVLGLNPLDVCLMSGAGTVHIQRYHHRYDQIPNGRNGNIPGAIANGIVRRSTNEDLPYLDLEGNWWRTNEPWLPHNAYYLLSLSELGGGERQGGREPSKSKAAGSRPAP